MPKPRYDCIVVGGGPIDACLPRAGGERDRKRPAQAVPARVAEDEQHLEPGGTVSKRAAEAR